MLIILKSQILIKVKEKVYDLLLVTTIHGIQNILRTSSLLIRILWLLCLIVSTMFCTYFTSKTILNYLNYDVTTTINNQYESQSQFPTISICSSVGGLDKSSILNCQFNSDDCSNYFELFKEINYGNCLRFNSGINIKNQSHAILESKVAGSKYGLKIDFNLTISPEYNYNELVVYFHNHSSKPVNLRHRGYRLSTGSIYYYEVNRVVDEKLGFPYNDCYKDINEFKLNKTIINFYRNRNDSYSQVECIRLCRNLKNYDQSNCNCARVDDLENTLYCSDSLNETVKQCYDNFTREFQKQNVFSTCSNYCPFECDSIHYSINAFNKDLSLSGNITKKGFEFSEFKTYEQVQRKYISIRAYYTELKYTYIKQLAKSELYDVVSSIGGTFGLFLGVSFLSFIEIIECIIETIFILAKK